MAVSFTDICFIHVYESVCWIGKGKSLEESMYGVAKLHCFVSSKQHCRLIYTHECIMNNGAGSVFPLR